MDIVVKNISGKDTKKKVSGTARAGDIKNPLFKGGGRVFGPRPRDYGFKLNIKQKRVARKSALSYKAKEGAITVVEEFSFDTPGTKKYIDLLNNLEAGDKKSLLVLSETNKNVYLSSRNLEKAKVVTASQINTYDLMNASSVIVSEGSIEIIENILKEQK